MILIAGSGPTKTDWCVVEHEQLVQQIFTRGTDPLFQSEEGISNEVATALVPQLKTDKFKTVHFCGTGCVFPDKIETVRKAIAAYLQVSREIRVSTDMLVATRKLYSHQSGIACIMGTGSNSCHYNGKNMVSNVSPLGFILGDESSGAVLNKLLAGNTLKNQMTPGPKEKFLKQYNLTPAETIDRVCRQPFPSHFLASSSPSLVEHLDKPAIRELILSSLKRFLKRNVVQCDYQRARAHFIGSIAFYYKGLLSEARKAVKIHLGTIIKSPMEGLIRFRE